MSFWDASFFFGEHSGVSVVPESNQEDTGSQLPDLNYEPDTSASYGLLDLNEEPYVNPSYLCQSQQDASFDGQPSYPQQSNSEFVYSNLHQSNQEFRYAGEPSEPQPTNQESDNKPAYPKMYWKTNQDFMTLEE